MTTTDATRAPQTAPVLQAVSIVKSFGPNTVLRGIDFAIKPGTIHALVGENGAGKSTLIKILTGTYDHDEGQVLFESAPQNFTHPRQALALGIGVVPQERQIIPDLSAAENVLLGHQPKRGPFVDHKRLYAEAATWMARVGLDIDPATKGENLSVAEQQLLEIARGLSLNSTVLFLDEPTASLTERETTGLLEVLRRLKGEGVALVYVSHKLSEVYAVADEVTVLRDGRVTLVSDDLSTVSRADLVRAMIGRDVSSVDELIPDAPEPTFGPVAMELRDVSTSYGHEHVSLQVRSGEILGLYGIVGSGRSELASAIIGKARITGGEVLVGGRPMRVRNPAAALHKHKVGYVSEDRKGEGLILDFDVQTNVSLTILRQVSALGATILGRRETAAVVPAVTTVGLDPARIHSRTGDLSGGNQQKVSVAKWVAAGVDVLIIDEPTVGVDVGAKEEIYRVIRHLAASGTAVVLISSELEEVVRLSDNVGVMVDGVLRTVLPNTRVYADMSGAIMDEITRIEVPAP